MIGFGMSSKSRLIPLWAKVSSFICVLHFSLSSDWSDYCFSQKKGSFSGRSLLILLAAPCRNGLLYVFEVFVIRSSNRSILNGVPNRGAHQAY